MMNACRYMALCADKVNMTNKLWDVTKELLDTKNELKSIKKTLDCVHKRTSKEHHLSIKLRANNHRINKLLQTQAEQIMLIDDTVYKLFIQHFFLFLP